MIRSGGLVKLSWAFRGGERVPLEMAVGASFQDGVGSTCSCLLAAIGSLLTRGWVLGEHASSPSGPHCLEIMSLRHTSIIADVFLAKRDGTPPSIIFVRTGDDTLMDAPPSV